MKVKTNLEVLVFSITNRCNLKCSFCSRSAKITNTQDLDSQIISKSIEDVMKYHKPIALGITGGEPLLYPKLFETLEDIKKYNIPIRLTTNATLLTCNIAKEISKLGIEQINTSLEGHTKEIHDSLRGKGSFEMTLRGINQLKKFKIPFFIKTTINKKNHQYIPEILKLVINLGAIGFAVSRTIPIGRAYNNWNEIEVSWKDYKKIIQKSLSIAKKHRINFLIDDPLKCLIDQDIISYALNKYNSLNKVWGGCRAGVKILYVMSDGSIIPCPALPLTVGNVYEDNIYSIWKNSEVLNKLREKENIEGICRDCKYLYICGGCRAMAYATTGNYLESDSFCPFVKI